MKAVIPSVDSNALDPFAVKHRAYCFQLAHQRINHFNAWNTVACFMASNRGVSAIRPCSARHIAIPSKISPGITSDSPMPLPLYLEKIPAVSSTFRTSENTCILMPCGRRDIASEDAQMDSCTSTLTFLPGSHSDEWGKPNLTCPAFVRAVLLRNAIRKGLRFVVRRTGLSPDTRRRIYFPGARARNQFFFHSNRCW